jgi:hypothetical protein
MLFPLNLIINIFALDFKEKQKLLNERAAFEEEKKKISDQVLG